MKLLYASAFGLVAGNQIVRFDDPKFLLSGIFDDNHLDAHTIFNKFLDGRWCHTLDDFSYPLEADDWTYLEDKPVEKWCKMWRLCRIETKRRELSCNQVNYRNMKSRGLNQQSSNFFANTKTLAYAADRVDFSNPEHLESKVLAGHVCETEYNETPCLKKTCNCDLQLADKVLNYVVEYYRNNPHDEDLEAPADVDVVAPQAVEAIEKEAEEDPESFDDKVVEIVQDHAVLVAEHTQLVEDIAHFKEKVQDVVSEHATNTLSELKNTLVPVDDSLEIEEEIFEEASSTADLVLANLVSDSKSSAGKLEEMNEFALGQIEEVGDVIEGMQITGVEGHSPQEQTVESEQEVVSEADGEQAGNTLEDIAAFNQDFVFEDTISIKK